jgi:hypothetical protein
MSQWVEVIVIITRTKMCAVEVEDGLSTVEAREAAEQVVINEACSDWDSISAEDVLYKLGIDPYDEVYKL